MEVNYDMVIVGGGLVGASLACALAHAELRIALLEAIPFDESSQPSYDERTVALAYGSRRILDGMGMWKNIADVTMPIKHIHVSQHGRFGGARFHHEEEGVEALGYVVTNRDLGNCLYARLSLQDNVTVHAPTVVNRLAVQRDHVAVGIEQDTRSQPHIFNARLAVAADGSSSVVRDLVQIRAFRERYDQTAIVCNVTAERHHEYVAYERFTDTGPLALLPMHQGRCALIWTHTDQGADALMALCDSDFRAQLQTQFGYRLGRFLTVGKRHAYPLSLIRAEEVVKPRIALLGNAARSLHPVAGQGFNLALRDVAALAEILTDRIAKTGDPGHPGILNDFASWRRRDFDRTIHLTDGLARIFTNPLLPLSHARCLGLLAMDLFPPLRHAFVRQTMGMSGRLPRLALGIPLGQVH